MLRLAGILYSMIATTLAGSLVVVALVSGYDTLLPILIAAAAGALVALPVTWLVTRAIYSES
ncbi:CTP synthetase [Salipiger thiooxidans]|jgi:zinc transporter ZupT|uniref:CTP synthetase n=1 Tax=Salipiger thiooxidans TaxID=282683 RepID=UPI001A8C5863|nr:CTP synthetase [Salipiger thiooxidans]MBN8185792.1 CTP synthetase [Salipiger thiooxidans]MBR9838358.1 CTP synthetase [Paracoccaceae bacterium]MCA0845864.1 CTP synthetase [Salipiger thiooxidans]